MEFRQLIFLILLITSFCLLGLSSLWAEEVNGNINTPGSQVALQSSDVGKSAEYTQIVKKITSTPLPEDQTDLIEDSDKTTKTRPITAPAEEGVQAIVNPLLNYEKEPKTDEDLKKTSLLVMVDNKPIKKTNRSKREYPRELRPNAVINKIEFTGSFTSTQKAVLTNRFKYLLSNYFNMSPAGKNDVERYLALKGVKGGEFSQLTISFDIADRTFIAETACNGCSLNSMHQSVDKLVEKVLVNDWALSVEKVQQISKQTPVKYEERSGKLTWHIAASSLALGSLFLSMEETKSYNSYVDETNKLKSSLSQATSSSEISRLNSQIQDNYNTIRNHKTNYQILSLFSLIGFGWEGYLIYDYYSSKNELERDEEEKNVAFSFRHRPDTQESSLSMRLRF